MVNNIPVLNAEQISSPAVPAVPAVSAVPAAEPAPEYRLERKLAETNNNVELVDSNPDKIQLKPVNISNNTLQETMSRGIGHYAICEFWIGTNNLNIREGILREVGRNYFILYNEDTDTSITCDLYSVKFVTFYRLGIRPKNGI